MLTSGAHLRPTDAPCAECPVCGCSLADASESDIGRAAHVNACLDKAAAVGIADEGAAQEAAPCQAHTAQEAAPCQAHTAQEAAPCQAHTAQEADLCQAQQLVCLLDDDHDEQQLQGQDVGILLW